MEEDGVTPTSGGSLVGKQLGDFQLQGLLGAGGMAEVYRGFDVKLKRQVAVKILPASMANDAGYVQRFKTEAQRVAALNHPHIVPVYHFGEDGQLLYHVMPILKESLRDRLDREVTLEPQDAVRLIVQIASALSVAHAAGLVHRDVKPENILLDDKGEAYLTDFGIARPVMPSRVGRAAQTLSATGLPVGTPEYMAPEQLRGEPMDQRADIYALGAVLYELLTGHAPHEAETPYEVAALSLMGKIDPPSALVPGIPEDLEDVIMIALASDPAARYPDASSFAFAARRAVFPRGRSLLTGLPGLRRATRENVLLSRPRRLSRADEPTHPLAPRLTRAIWAVPGGGKGGTGGTGRPQVTARSLLVAVAATALVVMLCGTASLSLARQMQLPILGFAPTATIHPTATLEPTATPEPTATATAAPTATAIPKPAVQAAFVEADTSTGGSWSGVFGSQGYLLAPNAAASYSSLPGYAVVNIGGANTFTWAGTTADPRALQKPSGAGGPNERIAACWFSSQSLTIDIGVTDGGSHRLAFYLLDWDSYGAPHGRVQRVDAVNAVSGATLDTRTLGQPNDSSPASARFSGGTYLVWTIRGHVRFIITNLNSNAVLSGIFFG
jgi:serine/threonine kinase PknH